MSDTPWYKDWFNSPFYHQLYFERNEKEAESFIAQLIQHLHPKPGARMIDLACGRGRHSKSLAAMGFDVTGVDLSPASIAYAQQFASPTLSFYEHDIRLPFWGNFFDYAFNFYTSFGYFDSRREHDAAMRTIANALKPGGIFVIDYLNVHYAEDHLVTHDDRQMGQTYYDLQRWHDDEHFYKKITITDPTLLTPVTYTEQISKFTLGDFTDMLSFRGLQVQDVYGDYQLAPYDIRKTPRMIIVARKKTDEPTDTKKRLYSDGRTGDALT